LYNVPRYGCEATNSLFVVVAPFSATHNEVSGVSERTTIAYIPGFKNTGDGNVNLVAVALFVSDGVFDTTISEGYLTTTDSGYQKSADGVAFTVGLIWTIIGMSSSSLDLKNKSTLSKNIPFGYTVSSTKNVCANGSTLHVRVTLDVDDVFCSMGEVTVPTN
jgi:hypothetical protein